MIPSALPGSDSAPTAGCRRERRRRSGRPSCLPEIVEGQRPATHDRRAEQRAIEVGIEHEADNDGRTFDSVRELLVAVRQLLRQRADFGTVGEGAEPPRERRRRAVVRLCEQHIDRDRGGPPSRNGLNQTRDRLARPRPRPESFNRWAVDVDDDHRQFGLRCRPYSLIGVEHDVECAVAQHFSRRLGKEEHD